MAFEVALLLFLGIVIVAFLATLGKPLGEAFAEKMKFNSRDVGSSAEKQLKEKINILENELLAVKQQVNTLQETVDFVTKEVEQQSVTIDTRKREKKEQA